MYDLVFVGNYTKDTIVSPSGTRHVDGGGFNYGAHAAAVMGLKVAAVSRLAKKDDHVVKVLKRIGVDVFPHFTPKSTHMRLHYPGHNVDERILTVTSTAGTFTCDQVERLSAKGFVITASTRDEVPLEIINKLRTRGDLIAVDVQGFVRVIAPDGPPEEATIWAAAVTSLKMESEGPIQRNITAVEELIEKMY